MEHKIQQAMKDIMDFLPDLKWFIIDIYKQRKFDNVDTFILRIIHSIQIMYRLHQYSKDHDIGIEFPDPPMTEPLVKCKFIFMKYFRPHQLPHCYSRMMHQLCKTLLKGYSIIDVNTWIKCSNIYLEQKYQKQIGVLSKLYQQWENQSFDAISPSDMEILHLHDIILYHRGVEGRHITPAKLTVFQNYLHHLTLHNPYDTGRFTKSHMASIVQVVSMMLDESLLLHIKIDKILLNKMIRIMKLLYQYHKRSSPHLAHNACNALFSFYFYQEYERDKALKYMRRRFKLMRKHQEYGCVWRGFLDWYILKWAVHNFNECNRILRMAINFDCNDQARGDRDAAIMEMEEMQDHEAYFPPIWIFDEKNKKKQRCVIKVVVEKGMLFTNTSNYRINKSKVDIRNQYIRYSSVMKRVLTNKSTYNIISNMIKGKQCNYIACNNKTLRRYKICKRCKSVFYCNRLHQKLDWNQGNHRTYCVKRDKRDHKILKQRYNLNIEDSLKKTAQRFFKCNI